MDFCVNAVGVAILGFGIRSYIMTKKTPCVSLVGPSVGPSDRKEKETEKKNSERRKKIMQRHL